MVASQRRRKNGRRSSQFLLYHQTSSGGVGAGVNLAMFTIPTGRQKLHPQPLPYLPTSPTRTQCLTLVYLFTRRCARAVVALARIFWLLSTSLSQQLISILPQSPTPRLCTCGCASHPLPNCCAHRDVVGVAECTRSLSPGRFPGCLAVVSSPLRVDVLQHQPGRDLVTLY